MVYDITQDTIDVSKLQIDDIINCPYSNTYQDINLPEGDYKLEVWGGEGGYRSSEAYAGKGGYSSGNLLLNENTQLYLFAGGSGQSGGANGGFNGGGLRGSCNGGGGASDVRINSISLYARVIVAGGGGSDGASSRRGAYGGGLIGGSNAEGLGTGGYSGTQTGNAWITTTKPTGTTSSTDAYAGFGFGGNGISYANGFGGAGGGGWYGGSGSYPDSSADDDKGGGGGSGYILTSSSAKDYPPGNLLTSQFFLSNTILQDGASSITLPNGSNRVGNTGNGYVRITIINIKTQQYNLGVKVSNTFKKVIGSHAKINGTWKKINKINAKINNEWR